MGCLCCKAPGDKYAPDLLSKVDDMMKKMSDMSNVIKGQPGVDIIRGRTLVIFVFGGPSSKKGRIVNELVATFNFKLIKFENLLLKELARVAQIAGPRDLTQQITKYIETNPKTPSLDLAFKLLTNEIAKDPKLNYLIDMIPNLHCFIDNKSFVRDPVSELKMFEGKFPISFAINFCGEEKVMQEMHQNASNEVLKSLNQEKSVEINYENMKIRTLLYENVSNKYLGYFETSQRLLTVHTGRVPMSSTVTALVNMFFEFKMKSTTKSDIKVVFTFGGVSISEQELQTHGIVQIRLKKELNNPDIPPDTVLQTIYRLIRDNQSSATKFYVNLEGTSVKEGAKFTQNVAGRIVFVSDECVPVSQVFPAELGSSQQSCSLLVKSVSTPENITCWFPQDTNKQLCKIIAQSMSECIRYHNSIQAS